MFKEQIGRIMEVYVDDMLVNSFKAEQYIKNFKETFGVLWKYKMKLNLAKCLFGVSSSKVFGIHGQP